MAEVVPLRAHRDPANYVVVHRRIKQLWNEGEYEPLPHLTERMLERSIDYTDIQHVVRYGRIVGHSRPKELWRYVIRGQSVDGEIMKCIIELDEQKLLLLSVMVKGRLI